MRDAMNDISARDGRWAFAEEFRSVLEAVPDAIVLVDSDGAIALVNSETERVFGYARDDLIGKPVEILIPQRFHRSHPLHRAGYFSDPRTRPRGSGLELTGIRGDGSEFPVEISLSPLIVDDRRMAMASIRDISERLRLEEARRQVAERATRELAQANEELSHHRGELQGFIDAMSTMSAKVAPDGRFLIVNKMAQRASGLALETLMESNLLKGHWWRSDEDVERRIHTAFREATEGALVSFEEEVLAFGSVITVHLTFVPVKAADGSVEYVVAEARDISRRVEVEDALKTANQELEAFTYSVSHDLRAPIRQIDGFSRLLTEQFESTLDPKAKHYLMRIRESTQHMGRLVDDLLRLAQLGRQELRPRVASLNTLVDEVVADVQGGFENRDIQWKIEPLPTVECDPGLIKVVLTNLVSNAVKYTRRRNPAVVQVGQTSRNGRPVVFVRDNGVGFDMRYADRLFGVFQRLHRAEDFEGTGVGLATVQRIVHKHGGEIWAESEPDRGASFFFTIGAPTGSAAVR